MKTFAQIGYCISMVAFLFCCFWRTDIFLSFVAGVAICAFYALIRVEEKDNEKDSN